MSAIPKPGILDPFDEPDHEQQRDRVVHPRLALERARKPLLQRRAAQHGEDRGRVGRGDGGAGQHPFERPEPEDPLRREPGHDRGDDGADGRQRRRGPEHRSDLRPAGGQASLEQDQDEGDRPQGAGELGIVELDPADPLRAGEHAEAEEQQQAGDPDPVGEERADDAGGEQGAGDEDQLRVMLSHPMHYAPSSAAARLGLELLGRSRQRHVLGSFVGPAVDQEEERRGAGRRSSANPISTRRNSSEISGSTHHPMKKPAHPIQRAEARRTWPWATQAWLTVTEREVQPHPEGDQQQSAPVVGELLAEGELHQLRPGDQDEDGDEGGEGGDRR